jgi:CHAD domain-containing protein
MDKPESLLDPQQLRIAKYIAKHSLHVRMRRRAQLLIAYHQGQSTALAAAQAGLSPGRVRYWRRQFKIKGMDIFPVVEKEPICDQPLEHIHPITPTDEVEPIGLPAPMNAPGLLPLDQIAEAGRKVLLFHFAEMLSHEEGTRRGENSEELHDMRVATRRMRAAFDIFNHAYEEKAIRPYLKGLKATGRALGRVRDMDVFIEKAVVYQQSLPAELQPGLEPLLKTWNQERDQDRVQMLGHLDSHRYQVFKNNFNKFLQTPGAGTRMDTDQNHPDGRQLVRDFAPVLIYNRLASVRAFEAILSNASLAQLHALRIEFKKLRYAIEFFQEVLGKQAKEVITALKAVQDHLGDLNDARVATQMIGQFMEAWEARQAQLPLAERESPEPIVAFLAAKHAERFRLMVTFPETWAKFNRPEIRQNLALAIAEL